MTISKDYYLRIKSDEDISVDDLCAMSVGLGFYHYLRHGRLHQLAWDNLSVKNLIDLLIPHTTSQKGFLRVTDSGWSDNLSSMSVDTHIAIQKELSSLYNSFNNDNMKELMLTLSEVIFVTVMDKIGPDLTIDLLNLKEYKDVKFIGMMQLLQYMHVEGSLLDSELLHVNKSGNSMMDVNLEAYKSHQLFISQQTPELIPEFDRKRNELFRLYGDKIKEMKSK